MYRSETAHIVAAHLDSITVEQPANVVPGQWPQFRTFRPQTGEAQRPFPTPCKWELSFPGLRKRPIHQLSHKPRCRPSSPQRCSISSSTSSTTSRKLSEPAALPPNHGFIEPGNTFSPTSNSPWNPASNCGRRRFRIPPTPPLITPAVLRFVCPESLLL